MATKLKDYKLKKKYERMISDINNILNVFSLTQRSLVFFKNYVAVQEIISVIETNKTILDMQKRKLEKELDVMKGEENEA